MGGREGSFKHVVVVIETDWKRVPIDNDHDHENKMISSKMNVVNI